MADVTPEKIAALRQALAEGNKVVFRNRAIIKRSKGGGLTVETPGKVVFSFGEHSYEKAYDCAVNGPPKRPRGPGKPFWFDPDKPRPPRPEWEECPF